MGVVDAHSASRTNQVNPILQQAEAMFGEQSHGSSGGCNDDVAFDGELGWWKKRCQGGRERKENNCLADIHA